MYVITCIWLHLHKILVPVLPESLPAGFEGASGYVGKPCVARDSGWYLGSEGGLQPTTNKKQMPPVLLLQKTEVYKQLKWRWKWIISIWTCDMTSFLADTLIAACASLRESS